MQSMNPRRFHGGVRQNSGRKTIFSVFAGLKDQRLFWSGLRDRSALLCAQGVLASCSNQMGKPPANGVSMSVGSGAMLVPTELVAVTVQV